MHGGVQEVQYKSNKVHVRLCGSGRRDGGRGCDDEEELLPRTSDYGEHQGDMEGFVAGLDDGGEAMPGEIRERAVG